MPRIPLSFVGGQSVSRSSFASDQQTINMYVRPEASGAKVPAGLYCTPGLSPYGTGGTGPCRGNGVVWDGNAYFVSGPNLVKVDPNGVFTTIGTLSTSLGHVSMAASMSYLMVVDGTDGYTYDGTTFATITDPDFPSCDYVEVVDSYFIVNNTTAGKTGQFHISTPDLPTAWNALDFATAEKKSDKLVRPVWYRGDLLAVGEFTSELYYDSGNADFPWDVYPNAIFEYGTPAGDSVVTLGPMLFMLAQDESGGYTIVRSASERPERISNPDIDWSINQMSDVSDAIGFAYKDAGHEFYQITFPSEDKTWVYDNTVGMWHERQSYGIGRHRVHGHVFFGGKHIVGDYANNQFYLLDNDVYTDNGGVIERVRVGGVTHKDRKNIFHRRVEIDFEVGVGLASGQGSDPQAILRWSDDGGHTWSNEHWQSIGKQGEYQKRAVWYVRGWSRARIYEVKVTDPVNVVILGMYADVNVGWS